MAMFKLCPECGAKYPLNEKRCLSCGYDEDCVCCMLRVSKAQDRECDLDSKCYQADTW